MAKNNSNSFWLSLKAHVEKANYYWNDGSYRNLHLANYHSACASKISDLKRKLTRAEKQKIYNSFKK